MGGFSSGVGIWLIKYYVYKNIYYLHYSDCAGS